MKLILEIPEVAERVLEGWALLNKITLKEHLTSLVRADVVEIVRSLGPPEFDAIFGLGSISVRVASELESEEVGRYAPFLEGVGIEQGRIVIKDNRLGRIAEVTFRNGRWFCDLDHLGSCVHVGFAQAVFSLLGRS